MTEPISRRNLLRLLGISGFAALAVAACGGSDGAAPTTTVSAEGAIRLIGTRYRELTPAEDDEATLTQLLGWDNVDDSGLADLAERVRKDFAEANTARVDGWVLSVTEARAAAVLSFT